MIAFIDEHRDQFAGRGHLPHLGCDGVWVHHLPRLPAAKRRHPSARAFRYELLFPEVHQIHAQNYGVYGVRKMHQSMQRAGWNTGRDQVAHPMKAAGLHRVQCGREPVTTRANSAADTRPDLVERRFVAQHPHQLWVADITYVRSLGGFCYTAFVTNVFTRKIVGWSVSSSLHTVGLPLLALGAVRMGDTGPG